MVDTHVSGACGEICGGSSPPIDTIKRLLTESFLMQVDCIGGRRTPQGEALSGSSGSGVLLFDVMKLQKTKHGIAVKCERPRQSRLRHHKKESNFCYSLFYLLNTKIAYCKFLSFFYYKSLIFYFLIYFFVVIKNSLRTKPT